MFETTCLIYLYRFYSSNEIESEHQSIIQEQESLAAKMETITEQIIALNEERESGQQTIIQLNKQLNSVKTENEWSECEVNIM